MKTNNEEEKKVPSSQIPKVTLFPDPGEEEKKQGFYHLPSSSATNALMEVLGAGVDHLSELEDRKKMVDHGLTAIEVYSKGEKRIIAIEKGKELTAVGLDDVLLFTGNNSHISDMLLFALIKANDQALSKGKLIRNYISFPLSDLVENGLYKSERSARKGFLLNGSALLSLRIGNKGGDGDSLDDDLEVLFTGRQIKNSQCILRLNIDLDWTIVAKFFTILPPYFFKLSAKAKELLLYIFYLARQNTKKINTEGYFNIGLRAIQERLVLPDESDNDNPGRTIREPIEQAIEEIEDFQKEYYNNTEFLMELAPKGIEKMRIRDFLDNGYLRVMLSGDFAKTFVEIAKETSKQIEKSRKKKESVVEKAKVKALSEKMKEENSSGSAPDQNGEAEPGSAPACPDQDGRTSSGSSPSGSKPDQEGKASALRE